MNKKKLKETIIEYIQTFVCDYQDKDEVSTKWGEVQVGFADAHHPYILNLKTLIGPDHGMPSDVLADARIVIAYFVPFTRELARENASFGRLSAPSWALAYEETNAMFAKLNQAIIDMLGKMGYHAAVSTEASTFDQTKLISNWSHRHFAYAAGLGTFGKNNMLLTKKGCCGRYSTIVTNLDVMPGKPLNQELCPYKINKSCGVCIEHCPAQALTDASYDRQKCYAVLRENAKIYTQFGSSYTDETGENANSEGSEVCGKCVTASPCMFWNRD